ncbi:hypothetical protein CVS40_1843, partial [Lucilia cuprina]
IKTLKSSVKILNEHRIKNDCIISGLKVEESTSAVEAVKNISKEVGVLFQDNDVEDAYFLKNKSKNNDKKTVVVKFASKIHKEKLMSMKSKLKENDETKKVYVNNFNSKETMNLFFYAKALKSIGYQFIFIRNGRVFCKKTEMSKQQLIHDVDDVDAILLNATTNKHWGRRSMVISRPVEVEDSSDGEDDYIDCINCNFLNIISFNIRSVSSIEKFNNFKSLLTQFPNLPDIIAIQETWLKRDFNQIYEIPGFAKIHCCRDDGYGGTSVYVNKNIDYVVNICKSENCVELIAITLCNFIVESKPLQIVSYYRAILML